MFGQGAHVVCVKQSCLCGAPFREQSTLRNALSNSRVRSIGEQLLRGKGALEAIGCGVLRGRV